MRIEYAVFGGVVVLGLVVLYRMTGTAGKIGQTLTDTGSKLGTTLADALTPGEWKYLGNPSRYEKETRTWFVLVDGKWIVDDYQTAQARKAVAVKPTGALKQ